MYYTHASHIYQSCIFPWIRTIIAITSSQSSSTTAKQKNIDSDIAFLQCIFLAVAHSWYFQSYTNHIAPAHAYFEFNIDQSEKLMAQSQFEVFCINKPCAIIMGFSPISQIHPYKSRNHHHFLYAVYNSMVVHLTTSKQLDANASNKHRLYHFYI